MTILDQKAIRPVLMALMRPVAAMLLRFGVTYQEFTSVCKSAFVQVATEQFGVRGRPTNISRVALMTGLTRKEVRRVRESQLQPTSSIAQMPSLPAAVLSAWHTDPRYSASLGSPKPLMWDSGPHSFADLVRDFAGTFSAHTMRAELLRVGAIAEVEGGLLVARRRYFIPATAEERLIQGFQYGLRTLALTVAHNAAAEESAGLQFQRIVWNRSLHSSRRSEFKEVINQRLEEFSEEIDDLLSESEGPMNGPGESVYGIGLYYFEDDLKDVSS